MSYIPITPTEFNAIVALSTSATGEVLFGNATGNGPAQTANLFWDNVTGGIAIAQVAIAAATPGILTVTGAAVTGLTATTEVPDIKFNLAAIKQWATGAIAVQRDALFQARTYAFVAASVVTSAATLAITGPPSAGANATITNPYALWVQTGVAEFGGNVAVGVAAPTARLHLPAVTTVAGTASLKINAGTLLTVKEQGAVESDGTHLWWTDGATTRQQLDGSSNDVSKTLTYTNGILTGLVSPLGTKTFVYTNGVLTSIVGTGSYPQKSVHVHQRRSHCRSGFIKERKWHGQQSPQA